MVRKAFDQEPDEMRQKVVGHLESGNMVPAGKERAIWGTEA